MSFIGGFFGGNKAKPKDDKPNDKEFNIFSDDDETITGYKNADTPNNPVMKGKTLSEKVNTADVVSNIEPVNESTDEYIDDPNEEEDEEDTREIKDDSDFADDPEAVDDDETRMFINSLLNETIDKAADIVEQRKTEIREAIEALPAPIKEGTKALMKSADRIVAKEEPEKNLALIANTMAYLPSSIMPYVADSVASKLLDAKDENGKPIFESKNEIIKMLKDLRNSKLSRVSKSGKKKVGKTKSGKGKRERDYLDYMLTKHINPAILITPRMK